MRERYFDNAATTPLDPRVLHETLPYLQEEFGNADSIHHLGLRARRAVELARSRVAELYGAEDPTEITFTSGATESNNWVLRQFQRIAVSPFEHSSIAFPAKLLGAVTLGNNGWLVESPDSAVDLVSLIGVNSDTGAILALPSTPEMTKVHRDLTQSLGKVRTGFPRFDWASMSAHKLYGPKGVGALYSRGAISPEAMILGGSQENRKRAGTLNVPGIVGLGAAAQIAIDEFEHDLNHAHHQREAFLEGLGESDGWRLIESDEQSPYIVCVCFEGVEGETMVLSADQEGFAVSSGPACSSDSMEPSPTLVALGIEEPWIHGAVRVSFGRFSQPEEAEKLGVCLKDSWTKVRKLGRNANELQRQS